MLGKRERSGSDGVAGPLTPARMAARGNKRSRHGDEAIVLSDSSDSGVEEVSATSTYSASLPLPRPAADTTIIVLGDSDAESPAAPSGRSRQLTARLAPRRPLSIVSIPTPRVRLPDHQGKPTAELESVDRNSVLLFSAASTEAEMFSEVSSPPLPPLELLFPSATPELPPVTVLPSASNELSSPGSDDRQTTERLSYLHIFDHILHTVLSGEAHLFSDQELAALRAFSDLERHSRYLYTRLFMRKHGWIRASALKNYGDEAVVEQSCKCLTARTPSHDPFAQSETEVADGDEALQLLTLPELKALAKTRGIKQMANKAKEVICAAILKSAKQRTVLSFFRKASANGSTDSDNSAQQRINALVGEVTKITGPMVRLCTLTVKLFEHVHLVFFRTPGFRGEDNPMKVAVLANIGQIRFPKYSVVRSPDLFASRDDVIQYKALAEISSQMSELGMAPVKESEKHALGWELFEAHREMWARHVKSLQGAVAIQSDSLQAQSGSCSAESRALEYWKRHFTPGSMLARIIERGVKFAANLKKFADEESILQSLLAQTAYRLGKRGDWYERLVLLHSTHLRPKRVKGGGPKVDELQRQALVTARNICIRALSDDHVGRISLHSISRQLRALEYKLALGEEQMFTHPRVLLEWREGPERTVYGVRVNDRTRRGPSQWDGDDEVPCSVERLALWRYQSMGFSGLHSENAMATTLFCMLFWDIIFHPLPGALDTEYQSKPLDMGSESFYYRRRSLIDRRLLDIADGDFADTMLIHYDSEFGAECVGVSWDITCDQLLTVAKYIGGQGLAALCQVLAREYSSKSSGFPDLCLWNNDTEKVLFVEVKGPNDKLSDSQRDWIDILLGSGIEVEVCLVREGDARDHECEE